MPWINKNSSPEEIAEELKANLSNKKENARLLIMGTETEKGYTMRMTLRHPEAIAGILYNHAIKTGELDEALKMCDHMMMIGAVAAKLIRERAAKSKRQN